MEDEKLSELRKENAKLRAENKIYLEYFDDLFNPAIKFSDVKKQLFLKENEELKEQLEIAYVEILSLKKANYKLKEGDFGPLGRISFAKINSNMCQMMFLRRHELAKLHPNMNINEIDKIMKDEIIKLMKDDGVIEI